MKDKRIAPRKQSWPARFSPEICHAWSLLQTELWEKGDSAEARGLIDHLRTELRIKPGSPLPAQRLHQATFPTRSRRPEMVDLPGPSSARPTAAQTPSQVVEQPAKAKAPPAPARAVLSDAELVEMHKDAQYLLAQGLTKAAMNAQYALHRAILNTFDWDYFDDDDLVEKMLDRIHERAFPDPARPPRLVIEFSDPRE